MLAWTPYLIQDVWAKMLDNREYTDNFLATNRQRLAEQYAFTTRFLDERDIPYCHNT
jgi:hypothetical protein